MQECSKYTTAKLSEQSVVALLHAYRFVATPVKMTLGLHGCCRYTPSCSHYFQEAVLSHGLLRGSQLGFQRLLRCHPWSAAGPDPVPAPTSQFSAMSPQ